MRSVVILRRSGRVRNEKESARTNPDSRAKTHRLRCGNEHSRFFQHPSLLKRFISRLRPNLPLSARQMHAFKTGDDKTAAQQ